MKNLTVALCHMLELQLADIEIFNVPFINFKGNKYSLEDKPDNGQCYGIYMPRHEKHVIMISNAECYNSALVESTVAHEMIHAWQFEKLGNRMQHGKRDYFTQWAEYILQELGIDPDLH